MAGSEYVRLSGYLASTYHLLQTQNNAIPYGFLQFSTNTPQIGTASPLLSLALCCPDQISQSNIAEAGTLTLEWETLSKYTKNATYGKLATGAVKHIANLVCRLLAILRYDIDHVVPAGSLARLFLNIIVSAQVAYRNDP